MSRTVNYPKTCLRIQTGALAENVQRHVSPFSAADKVFFCFLEASVVIYRVHCFHLTDDAALLPPSKGLRCRHLFFTQARLKPAPRVTLKMILVPHVGYLDGKSTANQIKSLSPIFALGIWGWTRPEQSSQLCSLIITNLSEARGTLLLNLNFLPVLQAKSNIFILIWCYLDLGVSTWRMAWNLRWPNSIVEVLEQWQRSLGLKSICGQNLKQSVVRNIICFTASEFPNIISFLYSAYSMFDFGI